MTTKHLSAIPAVAASPLLLTGCANYRDTYGDSPGTNVDVDGVLVRYARLLAPTDPQGWNSGDDVPLYMSLDNRTGGQVGLLDVTSNAAEDITLSEGSLPLDLPQKELVSLGPEGRVEAIDPDAATPHLPSTPSVER